MTRRVPSRSDDSTRRGFGEDGSTLIEVLVALLIAAGAVFVLIGGMSALFTNSFQNRESTTAGVVVRDYAEQLDVAVAEASVAAATNGTFWCAPSYTVAYTAPAGYVVGGTGLCPANTATTPQWETVTVTATTPNGATETLKVVVRQT